MSIQKCLGVASAFLAISAAPAAEGMSFRFRPLLAGRASLTEAGFVETRAVGTANFAPIEAARKERGFFDILSAGT